MEALFECLRVMRYLSHTADRSEYLLVSQAVKEKVVKYLSLAAIVLTETVQVEPFT